MTIWRRSTAGSWHAIARIRYPTTPQLGHCTPKTTGTDLNGAPNAVFIVRGCFTGDGAANAALLGFGARGFGLMRTMSANRMVSTGRTCRTRPAPCAVRWDIEVDHGRLVTLDPNGFFATAGFGTFPRVRFWTWRRDGLDAVSDTVFTAHPASAPDRSAPALPAQRCPTTGTYRVSVGTTYSNTERHRPNSFVPLVVVPPAKHYPSHPMCRLRVPSSLPMAVLVAHTSAPEASLRRGTITARRWIGAPVWFLIAEIGTPFRTTRFFTGDTTGDSPYIVPSSLGVNEILSRMGDPDDARFAHDFGTRPRPAQGTATFLNGKLRALAIF